MPEPTKAAIAVPAQDPKKKKPEEKPEEDVKDGAPKKDEEKEGEELVRTLLWLERIMLTIRAGQSEEDIQLKNELEMLIERLRVSLGAAARTWSRTNVGCVSRRNQIPSSMALRWRLSGPSSAHRHLP